MFAEESGDVSFAEWTHQVRLTPHFHKPCCNSVTVMSPSPSDLETLPPVCGDCLVVLCTCMSNNQSTAISNSHLGMTVDVTPMPDLSQTRCNHSSSKNSRQLGPGMLAYKGARSWLAPATWAKYANTTYEVHCLQTQPLLSTVPTRSG